MLCINILDNLFNKSGNKIEPAKAEEIAELISDNMIVENNNSTYTQEEIMHMISNKTQATIEERLNNGLLIYLTDKSNNVKACGMVMYNDERYFAKILHVNKEYRGKGYANIICDIREEYLRENNIFEIFIESLKYPNTIRFHKKRGFEEIEPYRKLKYSILMKKNLK